MRNGQFRKRIMGMPAWGVYTLIALVPGGMLLAFVAWLMRRAYCAVVNCGR
jgi:hypothetical protein